MKSQKQEKEIRQINALLIAFGVAIGFMVLYYGLLRPIGLLLGLPVF